MTFKEKWNQFLGRGGKIDPVVKMSIDELVHEFDSKFVALEGRVAQLETHAPAPAAGSVAARDLALASDTTTVEWLPEAERARPIAKEVSVGARDGIPSTAPAPAAGSVAAREIAIREGREQAPNNFRKWPEASDRKDSAPWPAVTIRDLPFASR